MQTLQKQTENNYKFALLSVCDFDGTNAKKEAELLSSIQHFLWNEKYYIKLTVENDEVEYILNSVNNIGYISFSNEQFAMDFINNIMEPIRILKEERDYWLKGDLQYFKNNPSGVALEIRQTNFYHEQLVDRVTKGTFIPFQWHRESKTRTLNEYIAINEQIFECKEDLKKLGLN